MKLEKAREKYRDGNLLRCLRLIKTLNREIRQARTMTLQEFYLLSRIHSQTTASFLASVRVDKLDADLARLRKLAKGDGLGEGLNLDTPLGGEVGEYLKELIDFIARDLNRIFPAPPSLNSPKKNASPAFYVPVRVVKGR